MSARWRRSWRNPLPPRTSTLSCCPSSRARRCWWPQSGFTGCWHFGDAARTGSWNQVALDAQSSQILAMLAFQGLRPASVGMACGLLAAFGLTRLISGFLFGGPTEPGFATHFYRCALRLGACPLLCFLHQWVVDSMLVLMDRSPLVFSMCKTLTAYVYWPIFSGLDKKTPRRYRIRAVRGGLIQSELFATDGSLRRLEAWSFSQRSRPHSLDKQSAHRGRVARSRGCRAAA